SKVFGDLVPEAIARRHQVIPIGRRRGSILLAMADPDDVMVLDDLRMRLGVPMIAVMADAAQVAAAIEEAYSRSAVRENLAAVATDDEFAEEEDLDDVEQGPIVRLVDSLLEEAASDRASDIHIEPGRDGVKMRFRIDGVLHDISEASTSVLRPILSRVKVLAELDIAQSRLPQDGRFTQRIGGDDVDVRVATVPTVYGEAAVLRLLDRSTGLVELSRLGIAPEQLARYKTAFEAAQGAVLVTGPTGSGKTSTLYSTVAALDTRDRSVMSVEDPVEYKLRGVKQMQVNRRAGLTFPVALRAMLRSDPDIILVGEIRDGETATIAAGAAMSGHLVFSTMHTTSAASSPARFIEMGVEPYVVTSAISCIVAQRLARRLCDACAAPLPDPEAILRRMGVPEEAWETAKLRRAVGCDECHGTGFYGRVGCYEIMLMSDDIRELVLSRAPAQDIERYAIAEGMQTLRDSGMSHVLAGQTTVEEMLRVIS
ncbi:MAG TPA: GspE/PulE family protein, partial [Acidimicrobiia bacterium]|nr:GspE/PulE family protein [Acidimicrobiia bacterium]